MTSAPVPLALIFAAALTISAPTAAQLGWSGDDADLARAMMACEASFASSWGNCTASVPPKCSHGWTLPACDIIEQRWRAPGGPADRMEKGRTEQRELDRTLIERMAK